MSASEVRAFLNESSVRWIIGQSELTSALESNLRVQTVNLHHLVLFERDSEFKRSMLAADALAADGWPVQELLNLPSSARATGSAFMRELVGDREAATFAKRVALIGASDTAAQRLSVKLGEVGRQLMLHVGGDANTWVADEIADRVRDTGVDLIVVAVTPPRGEVVARALKSALPDHPVIGVGGAVDMVVGLQKSAPKSVRNLRGEWLWRLCANPKRMYKRYIVECLPMYLKLKYGK